ncbi:ABC-2 type transport system permease protein [Nocardia caishijiensis]|uniref:ABC-2 type transport system permease protein n=1 Tax=Nocardia caishijiensis TaxID=184756 RepID=A0ABQ6YQT3_9NOCA|nr:ABC transporter permease [Nocardia caishijiensis]KAF0848157.1 ABC-2 type transport system permease protein [Nocardia caishijiensis]
MSVSTPAAKGLFADLPQVHQSSFAQWRALTGRIVRTMATKGELIVAVLTPLVVTVAFYLPLRYVMKVQGIDYAQYVMPIIVLQTMAMTMMSNAQLAAFEALTGLSTRLQTMPIGSLVPLLSRICAGLVRSVVSLIATVGYGYLIGFRFTGGVVQALAFCGFALAVGVVLTLGADALGSLTKNPEALSQALTLPILIFGMMSTGFVPENSFPTWARGFARNQPISQFAQTLSDMAEGHLSWAGTWVSLVWLGIAAVVFLPLAVWASVRRS